MTLFGSVLLCSSSVQLVHAQETAFQLQQFRPWGDANGMFQTQSGQSLRQWDYAIGFYLNYGKDPLVLRNNQGRPNQSIVAHQIGADVFGAIGLLDWLEVGLVVPMTLYQSGRIPDIELFSDLTRGKDVSGFAMSDIKIQLKTQALRQETHHLNLGFRLFLGLPTGNKDKFNGEEPLTFGAAILLNRWFAERVNVALNVGYRYLPPTQFGNLLLQHELTYSLGIGVRVSRQYFDLLAEMSGATALSDKTDRFVAPLDVYFGGRIYPLGRPDLAINVGMGLAAIVPGYGAPQVRALLGLTWAPKDRDSDKDGLVDRLDRCPKQQGPIDNRGCPWGDKDKDGLKDDVDRCPSTPGPRENGGCPWGDKDKDGLKDNVDKCPNTFGVAENKGCPDSDKDKDGLKDNIDKCPNTFGPKSNGGCPWGDKDKDGLKDNVDKCPNTFGLAKLQGCPDSDKDGIADMHDKCPLVPGLPERQGCPKKVLVAVTKGEIKILQRIYFRTSSAKIQLRSYEVLNQVVSVLKSRPKLQVRVEGHTDDVGSARSNLRLSQKRANSVRLYLVNKGIDGGRLAAKGFGESKPLIKKKDRASRAKNRRVQFNILKGQLNP